MLAPWRGALRLTSPTRPRTCLLFGEAVPNSPTTTAVAMSCDQRAGDEDDGNSVIAPSYMDGQTTCSNSASAQIHVQILSASSKGLDARDHFRLHATDTTVEAVVQLPP